ncbi:MAG: M14 family zinc carboxypeptidase [Saprospiraceae bacterium]
MAQTVDLATSFEKDNQSTATYREAIDFYKKLDAAYPQLQLTEWGMTDSGHPLHVAVLSKSEEFDPAVLRQQNKRILLINNAIHPGEPEGVDATMLLLRTYLQSPELKPLLDRVVLVVIPYYNIGGGLNRGCCSRANQNGPKAYGFRGNAKNLDLNRDFIKCDSKNAQTFTKIFNHWQPDVFIDNHTSNGADYPYTMTMLATQEDKLGSAFGEYLRRDFGPRLYRDMAARHWEMVPYVNVFGKTPDAGGINGFYDSPRYSSGFAALHHCMAFVPETHMLKPFPQRVAVTYAFMDVMIHAMCDESENIARARQASAQHFMEQDSFVLDWKLNKQKADSIVFKGYEGKYKKSEVTGMDRLWYDREAPFVKTIPYRNYFEPSAKVKAPVAYIIPQAYEKVIQRLQWNGVEMKRLVKDISAEWEMYYIKNHKTGDPYEGHYLHRNVEVEKKTMTWGFHAGDYVVYVKQPAARYIVETLEPQGYDSFFAWNFFDAILGQKEWFSAYVFEDIAAGFLKDHPEVRQELEARKKENPKFAGNQWAQLGFVYYRTPYYEPTHNLYPVARVTESVALPVE